MPITFNNLVKANFWNMKYPAIYFKIALHNSYCILVEFLKIFSVKIQSPLIFGTALLRIKSTKNPTQLTQISNLESIKF